MRRAAAAILLAVMALTGCTTTDLAFVEDRRVRIRTPKDGARVSLPVTVEWTAEGLDLREPGTSPDGVFFGVFVDRATLRPGASLLSLVGDDCRVDGCADLEYFADKGVHLTADTSLVLDRLRRTGSHQVSIVLIDQQYRRVGESVFVVEFRESDDA